MTMSSRVWTLGLASGLLALIISGPLAAQGADPGDPQTDPPMFGQWAGPYDFAETMNPNGLTPNVRWWRETVHAAVLPPPNNNLVIFWNRRETANSNPHPDQAFVWDANDPEQLVKILDIDPTMESGKYDLFCSGHTWGPDGELVVFGGTDVPMGLNFGHARVHILDTSIPITPTMITNPWFTDPAWDMRVDRWYATALAFEDGTIYVTADAGDDPPPLPGQPVDGATWNRATIDRSLPLSSWLTWEHPVTPAEMLTDGIGCVSDFTVDIGGYPRLIMLANVDHAGDLMRNRQGRDPIDDHLLFDLEACLTTPDEERWITNPAIYDTPGDANNVAHFIDASGGAVIEYVYNIGGGAAETCCLATCAESGTTSNVMVMVNPNQVSTWTPLESLPDPLGRMNANTVILLDGSFIVFGGGAFDDNGTPETTDDDCVAIRKPWIFKPGWLFSGNDVDTWLAAVKQAHDRQYHSTAGLLPSGKAVSAGGTHPSTTQQATPAPSWNSIEVYSPPYLFQGMRPRVNTISPDLDVYDLGMELTLGVLISGNESGEFRVALLRPASVTHAFDFAQRYVKIAVTEHAFVAPPATSTIKVTIPTSNAIVPPGWYMLTVVDSAGVPSIARWIKIGST